jgi:hypothetical protein
MLGKDEERSKFRRQDIHKEAGSLQLNSMLKQSQKLIKNSTEKLNSIIAAVTLIS